MSLDPATARQAQAAQPGRSIWLAANAGSGKTRVLTNRVARLLLSGARPEQILCITYTKAAAAEMQNRLFRTLGAWAMLVDSDLRKALGTLGETALTSQQLRRARTLFACAIETPGGLQVQTIHAFCARLLRRFPPGGGGKPPVCGNGRPRHGRTDPSDHPPHGRGHTGAPAGWGLRPSLVEKTAWARWSSRW